jgi:hypothetical protein
MRGALPNPIHPDRMSADERIAEIAEILAAGLMRLRARKSSPLSRDHRESSLDFSVDQRGQGHRASIPVAQDAGKRQLRHHCGNRRGREDQCVLRRARAEADAAGAGHRRGDTG